MAQEVCICVCLFLVLFFLKCTAAMFFFLVAYFDDAAAEIGFLPWEFSVVICRSNLPQLFAAAICQEILCRGYLSRVCFVLCYVIYFIYYLFLFIFIWREIALYINI